MQLRKKGIRNEIFWTLLFIAAFIIIFLIAYGLISRILALK